jgi:DNA-binding transcriptional LysR family regulator
VLVRLDVQVLATVRAEPGAIVAAQDLLRHGERDNVARPVADLQLVVGDVVRAEIVGGRRVGVMELARTRVDLELREPEAAHARPDEVCVQPEVEHGRARGPRDLHVDGDGLGVELIALAPEEERLRLDVDALIADLTRTEAQAAEIDRAHRGSVALLLQIARLAGLLGWYHSIMEADRWLGLDLRHLVALKAIADEGSFGRAAEKLGYTQSAISQQIATLERIVGLRLVERPGGPRPVSLTQAGHVLLRHADAIQARLLAAKADMNALEAGDAGRLRVGTFQSVGVRILPTLLRRFSDSHPGVEVLLRESSDESELMEMVERGELDLTFWTLPCPSGPYESVELLRDPYVLVVPSGSPLAGLKRAPTLKEIGLHPIIGFNQCSAMDEVESRLAAAGRPPNIVFRSDNNGTVQGLVGAGVGVALTPLLTVETDDPNVDVIDLQGRIDPRIIGLVWHADRHTSPAAQAFVESAVAVCREVAVEPAAA